MQCKWYDKYKDKESCPFDIICPEECHLVFKKQIQEIPDLLNEIKKLEDQVYELQDANCDYDELSENYNELEETFDNTERVMFEYIKELVEELSKYQKVSEPFIPDTYYLKLDWYDTIKKEIEKLNNKQLKIVVEDKYLPKYANETDACMDLKASISNETGTIVIKPNETVKIGTGVKVAIPEGYVMKMYVRSSTGIKKNLSLANGTGIIDAGYRDEIIMALHNFGNEPVEVHDGDRVCQFMILPFPKIELQRVKEDDIKEGNRGGGIGSTGV